MNLVKTIKDIKLYLHSLDSKCSDTEKSTVLLKDALYLLRELRDIQEQVNYY